MWRSAPGVSGTHVVGTVGLRGRLPLAVINVRHFGLLGLTGASKYIFTDSYDKITSLSRGIVSFAFSRLNPGQIDDYLE